MRSASLVNQDTLSFLGEIWTHKPVIIVLLASIPLLLTITVTDAYRYRKKEHQRRDKRNHDH